MGFRFRKSIKVVPGVKLNINRKSVGVSLGGKQARISINSKGKPKIEDVINDVCKFIDDCMIAGHNITFDLGFLRTALLSNGLQKKSNMQIH